MTFSLLQVEEKLNQNEDWFKNLWENQADQYEFHKLAVEIKPSLSFSEFEKGWQYRTVLHPSYKQARIEFINILFGWY